jgi:hypothetical protein
MDLEGVALNVMSGAGAVGNFDSRDNVVAAVYLVGITHANVKGVLVNGPYLTSRVKETEAGRKEGPVVASGIDTNRARGFCRCRLQARGEDTKQATADQKANNAHNVKEAGLASLYAFEVTKFVFEVVVDPDGNRAVFERGPIFIEHGSKPRSDRAVCLIKTFCTNFANRLKVRTNRLVELNGVNSVLRGAPYRFLPGKDTEKDWAREFWEHEMVDRNERDGGDRVHGSVLVPGFSKRTYFFLAVVEDGELGGGVFDRPPSVSFCTNILGGSRHHIPVLRDDGAEGTGTGNMSDLDRLKLREHVVYGLERGGPVEDETFSGHSRKVTFATLNNTGGVDSEEFTSAIVKND